MKECLSLADDSEAYIAPEAFDEKKFSTKSDIFGLGAVFMRLIAGRVIFRMSDRIDEIVGCRYSWNEEK